MYRCMTSKSKALEINPTGVRAENLLLSLRRRKREQERAYPQEGGGVISIQEQSGDWVSVKWQGGPVLLLAVELRLGGGERLCLNCGFSLSPSG